MKQDSSNATNTEQEFKQYQSEMGELDNFNESKEIIKTSQGRITGSKFNSQLNLNESESDPALMAPRRLMSNQTQENGAIYSVNSS